MSKNKKLVPKRRFNRFEKDKQWFIEKLSSFAEFSKGNGYSKNDLCEQGLPILLYGRLYTQYETIIRSVDTFIINKKDSTVFSSGDEVVVPASGETAKDIARASFIHKSGIIIGGDLNIIKPKDKVISHFLAISLSSGDQKKELIKRAQGKTVVHLHNSELKDIKFIFPTIKEQTQIGEFFKKLDDLIQTQQKKLEKTKTLKSAYLAEMFPCDGELKPHYRFQCFNEVWTKNLFYNLANIRRGLTYNPSHLTNDGIRILRSSNIDEDRFIIKDDDIFINEKNVNIPVVSENDVLITAANGSSRLVGKHALISLPKSQKAVHGGFMLLATSKQPFFTNALLSSNWYRKFLNVYIAGGNGSIGNLNKKTIENQLIKIPSTKEQTKIGNFFKLLDKKIALEQRKLEKLNNIKQAYLNEMFV